MSRVATFLRSQTRQRLLARAGRSGIDLTRLDRVPDRLTWPLQRDGLDPVTRLGAVRDAEPVHLLTRPSSGLRCGWLTGPAEARAVLANDRDFSNDIRPFMGARGAADTGHIGGLGFTDPPEHTRLRRLLTPQFTMRRLERLRPLVTDIVERQLDVLQANGPEQYDE